MTKSIFITGTDTGVGKTIISAALALLFQDRGYRVGVMKPVETGCLRQGRQLVPPDATFLKKALRSGDALSLITPYRLSMPVSPWAAAKEQRICIEPARIHTSYNVLSQRHDLTLVEGAGGLLVPLSGKMTMLDLAQSLGSPLLIVAPNRLGVINHVLLTLHAARSSGIRVIGVVINNSAQYPDPSARSNVELLAQWVQTPLLGPFPYIPRIDHTTRIIDKLRKASGSLSRILHLIRDNEGNHPVPHSDGL